MRRRKLLSVLAIWLFALVACSAYAYAPHV
jgi:hypothetical protein